MRSLGDFKILKESVMEGVLGHPEIKAALEADPFRGKWPNPAKVEVFCHWDQSMSLVLTEAILCGELLGPNHLKRIVSEVVPTATVFGMDTKRALSQSLVKTRVTFQIPEDVPSSAPSTPAVPASTL